MGSTPPKGTTAQTEVVALAQSVVPPLPRADGNPVAHPYDKLDRAARAATNAAKLGAHACQLGLGTSAAAPFSPGPNDHRFSAQEWQTVPFTFWQQALLAAPFWRLRRLS